MILSYGVDGVFFNCEQALFNCLLYLIVAARTRRKIDTMGSADDRKIAQILLFLDRTIETKYIT